MTDIHGFVDVTVVGDMSHLTTDETIGLLSTHDPEHLPRSLLVDHERLERALSAYRMEFGDERSMNVAIVRNREQDMPSLALYPNGTRDRAVVVAPQKRPDDEDWPDVAEVSDA